MNHRQRFINSATGCACLGAVLVLLSQSPYAFEIGNQQIEKDTVWDGPVTLRGVVRIVPGVTLTLRPGVTVTLKRKAEGQNGLVIAGRFNALGTEDKPVTFTSPEGTGNAGFLRGEKGAWVRLEHCTLQGLGGRQPLEAAFRTTEVNGDEEGQGVTVRHCRISDCWGGVCLTKVQSAVVEDCDIGPLRGGGCVSLSECHFVGVHNCRLHSENAGEGCNGVDLHVTADSEILGNTLYGNWAGVYGMWATGNILERNVIHGNGDGVRWWKSSDNQVVSCTLTGNRNNGLFIIGQGEPYPGNVVKDCLLAFNANCGVEDAEGTNAPTVSCSDAFGNGKEAYHNCKSGKGCVTVDPQFVDPQKADYRLKEGSPCIDTGDPQGLDMGAFDQGRHASESAASRPKLAALGNAGFETTGDDKQTLYWKTSADGSGQIAIGLDEKTSHTGKRSLRIRIEGQPGAERRVRSCGFYQLIKVLPRRYYLISCWMKGEGARGWPGARIYSEFMGDMQAGPDHTGDYDWKPVSLCVYSKTARSIPVAGYAYIDSGSVWFDDFSVREIPKSELGDWTPKEATNWKATAEDSRRGYVLFSRPTVERVYHTALPRKSEVTGRLSLWAARNQTASANLLLHSLGPVKNMRLQASDLRSGQRSLPASAITCRVVDPYRYMLDGYCWILVPLFLRSRESFDIPPNDTAQVYVTIKVPEETPPGEYRGTITISCAQRPSTRVALLLKVLPLTLERPDCCFFQYYSIGYVFPSYRGSAHQRLYMENMRDHGFTGITIYDHCEVPDGQGGWKVDVERKAEGDPMSLAESMTMAMETGLMKPGNPLVYLDSYSDPKPPEGRHDFGGFLGGGKSVMALEAERKKRGWPEFLYYMVDEPGDEQRNAVARAIFEKTYKGLPVRTVTALGQLGIDRVGELYKVWIVSWGDMKEALMRQARERQRELWTYECWSMAQLPEMARYYAGFWSYRCGVKGNGDWAYVSTNLGRGGTVYPHLDEKGQYLCTDNYVFGYALPGPAGPIDTIGLELRREGIDDFRYCGLLDRLIERGSSSKSTKVKEEVAKARALREGLRRRFRCEAFNNMAGGYIWFHDYRPQPELGLGEYDRLRRALAEQCLTLTRMCGGQPPVPKVQK